MQRIRKIADKLIPESVFRLLSYFVVIPGRRIQSSVNGRLEINYANGKKMLDSANTNYSYGSLQQVLRFGLKKMDLSAVSSVLVLGLGGGSVIGTLRRDFGFHGHITGVEVDPVMIEISSSEFGLIADTQLSIVSRDAMDFLNSSSDQFDLIIVDLFLDKQLPEMVFSSGFWEAVNLHLSREGQFLLNAGFDHQADKCQNMLRLLSQKFSMQKLSAVGGVNLICIGRQLPGFPQA